ncbi:MAG: cupin domain-containing protein [Rhodopirellula sp. JB055]|uniref:cupin domain-containing protein n=1 Tax=Rhodopirellula sp. JB055 TaxID=3342846 RepID=UPI00370BF296
MKLDSEHAQPANPQPDSKFARAELVDFNQIEPVECPCGLARRAFADSPHFPGTVHLTQISQDARSHFHQAHTEIYVILDCEADAAIELDGKLHPVRPRMSILIPPHVKHRAVGKMEVLIVCTPEFDPADEFFEDPGTERVIPD